jgi:hypothetical protein
MPVGSAAAFGAALMAGFVLFVPTFVTEGFVVFDVVAEGFEGFDVGTEGAERLGVVAKGFEGLAVVAEGLDVVTEEVFEGLGGFLDVVAFLVEVAFLIVALTRRSST